MLEESKMWARSVVVAAADFFVEVLALRSPHSFDSLVIDKASIS